MKKNRTQDFAAATSWPCCRGSTRLRYASMRAAQITRRRARLELITQPSVTQRRTLTLYYYPRLHHHVDSPQNEI